MTIDEKRKALDDYCGKHSCDNKNCVLYGTNKKWSKPLYNGCPDFQDSPESEIEIAFKMCGIEDIQNETQLRYWSNICEMQKKQTEKGLKKYGQVLEENTAMTILERLEYLQEELIDGLMYIEHIKAMLTKENTKP